MTYDPHTTILPNYDNTALSRIGEIKPENESTQGVKLSLQCPISYKLPGPDKALASFSSKINQPKGIVKLRQSFSNFCKTLKAFFHKSPGVQVFCRSLNIPQEQFKNLHPQLQAAIVHFELISGDGDLPVDAKLASAKALDAEFKKNLPNQQELSPELTEFHEDLQNSIHDIEQEKVSLFKQVVVDGKVIKEKADVMSYNFGGQRIANKLIYLTINGKEKKVKLSYTPQKLLSEYPDDPHMKNCSSETHGRSSHIPNLWRHEIDMVDGNTVNFLRHGCTYGKDSATKELLANSLSLGRSEEEIMGLESSEANPITIKLSNIQLMTEGKPHLPNISDSNLPTRQMDMLKELSNKESIELNYKGKKIFVKLDPPLLFNFGTNMQQFKGIFQPLVNHKASDAANLESFKKLFGDDFPNIKAGSDNPVPWKGEVGKALASEKSETKKQQIIQLAKTIVTMYKNHPHGVASNSYALPAHTILLTSLLGYPTSYNCKSGKDRTGMCSIELTQLAAQVLGEGELSDPTKTISPEEKNNLQAIYISGEANQIAKTNTGQETLKLPSSVAGIKYTAVNDRLGMAAEKPYAENRFQYLKEQETRSFSNTQSSQEAVSPKF